MTGWKFTNRTYALRFVAVLDMAIVWLSPRVHLNFVFVIFRFWVYRNSMKLGDRQEQGVQLCSINFPKRVLLHLEQGSCGTIILPQPKSNCVLPSKR